MCDICKKETPTLLSWTINTLIMRLKANTIAISRPIPTRHLCGNVVKMKLPVTTFTFYAKMRAKTCSLISLYAKYAYIFEKETTKMLSWRIYIWIDFMLPTPLTSRTTGSPERHLEETKGDSWSLREINPSTFITRIYMYTVHKGRYSDKQTTKLSVPLSPLVYRFDTKLTIDSFYTCKIIYLRSVARTDGSVLLPNKACFSASCGSYVPRSHQKVKRRDENGTNNMPRGISWLK